jgi:citrate lyase subunit beta/citryl-CoA lyase
MGNVQPLLRGRSMLFMPGSRPDMVAKIARFAPDLAVVDLEDAVAVADKDSARSTAESAIDALPAGDGVVLVRVNPIGTTWFADDLAMASRCAADGIVVPKLDGVAQLEHLHAELDRLSWSSPVVVAGVETVLGVADARAFLGAGVSAAYFGAEDYIADIGGRRTAAGDEVLYARSQVVLAAFLNGVPAIDQAVVAFGDPEKFRADARAGADLGYQGKICIHPSQVALAHDVHTPDSEQVAHARAVVEAGAAGVSVIDGQMVDDVHLRMARTVLARAALSQQKETRP